MLEISLHFDNELSCCIPKSKRKIIV